MNILKYLTPNFMFCVFPKNHCESDYLPVGIELTDKDRAALYEFFYMEDKNGKSKNA